MKKVWLVLLVLNVFILASCSGAYDGYNSLYDGYVEDQNTEGYDEIIENTFINTEDMPVSTFSADVDTASYSNVRRFLEDGTMPYKDAVRIEEMINYFTYDLEGPSENEAIHVTSELSTAPWNENHQLLMLGLKTEDIVYEESAGMNLVFLLDVSGSMNSYDKLPLLKEAFALLLDQLRPSDVISIVVYAGAAGVVLEGADVTDKDAIYEALDNLQAGGSTAGGEGINLAYKVAERNYIEGGNNRIILATDGDFNVGISSVSALEDLISEKRDSGVFLSVLGFGTGNLKDNTMESLADHGNGVYYYIDGVKEAEKVFVHELGASLVTVAKDVKLQIEFNPASVKGYRLIGYENRVLNYDDFSDDTKDAGDMGAGHSVIAFYEIIPADSSETIETKTFDIPETLRYTGENYLNEYANLQIRYKDPNSDTSMLIEHQTLSTSFTDNPSETFRFASAVVEFGLLLRDSSYKYQSSYQHVIDMANQSLGDDTYGYRHDFVELVGMAKRIAESLGQNSAD